MMLGLGGPRVSFSGRITTVTPNTPTGYVTLVKEATGIAYWALTTPKTTTPCKAQVGTDPIKTSNRTIKWKTQLGDTDHPGKAGGTCWASTNPGLETTNFAEIIPTGKLATVLTNHRSFSVDLWIKPISVQSATYHGVILWAVDVTRTELRVTHGTGTEVGITLLGVKVTIPVGSWSYVAFTIALVGSGEKTKGYVDAVLKTDANTGTDYNSSGTWWVCGNSTINGVLRGPNIKLSRIAFYDGLQTATQIAARYANLTS